MNVASMAVLAKLRDEVRVVAEATVVLAHSASFRRVARRGKLVAMLELPPSARSSAEKRRQRLIWCGRVLDALLRRYAVSPPAKAAHLANSMAAYVVFERELPASVPEGRSRQAFDLELRELQRQLEETIDRCAAVVEESTPQIPKAVIDIHIELHGTTARINGAAVSIPFAEIELRQMLADYRRPSAAAAAELSAPLAAFGQKLFRLIAPAYRDGHAIRLHLQDAGSLAACAWELLHDGRNFLALQPATPITRAIALPFAANATDEPPLRVLLTISSPPKLKMLDAKEELRRVEDAIGGLMLLGLIELDVALDGTFDTLRRMLRTAAESSRPYGVWHFVGHGRYGARRGELAMEGGADGVHWIGGHELQVIFGAHPPLRLAILNACETGVEGIDDPRTGLATTLIGCGAATVIATQFQISDAAAIVLAEEVYGAYVAGADITAAITEARRAIFCRPRGVEWMTPIVFVKTQRDKNTS